jgi:hypothetical protein
VNQDLTRPGRRSARVVEHRHGAAACPEPYRTPVLPSCWAPLDSADEASVLQACDEFPEAVRLRLPSLWDAAAEFRVYCLESEVWRGVCAATVFTIERGRNSRLLAIAQTPADAARVALDFLNWDLEADGSDWRLTLSPAR